MCRHCVPKQDVSHLSKPFQISSSSSPLLQTEQSPRVLRKIFSRRWLLKISHQRYSLPSVDSDKPVTAKHLPASLRKLFQKIRQLPMNIVLVRRQYSSSLLGKG